MDCPEITADPDGIEFIKEFNRKARRLHIPLSGSIAITHRCNLRCKHCYLGDHKNEAEKSPKEMSTAMILGLIDDITKAGCLNLLITGGEPFLRKDFNSIYRLARSNGLLVNVFTNATLLSEQHIELFRELPPKQVEITLYGASEKTYENVTGIKGSFKRCLKGIELLLANNIFIGLKTIVMTLNRHELEDMKKIADDYGVKFRFDPMINGCFNGVRDPVELRITPEEIVSLDAADEKRMRLWLDLYNKFSDVSGVSDNLYNCGAGIATFHIDPYGRLQPCIMTVQYPYDLNSGSFSDGWNNHLPLIRKKKAAADFACSKCKDRILCGFCPPFFFLENGDEQKISKFCCSVGKERGRLVRECLQKKQAISK